MKKKITGAAIVACFAAIPAAAQNVPAHTFVSAKGSDTGTCAPATSACRTFAYAVAQTQPGGEVVALDAAGYGSVTITKAISLAGPGKGLASISVPSGGTGITISAGASDLVVLRGLEVDGASFGIAVNSAGSVFVSDSVFANTEVANFNSRLVVRDSLFIDSTLVSEGATLQAARVTIFGGLVFTSSITAVLDGCVISGGSAYGVRNVRGSLFVRDSLISGYGTGISTYSGASTTYIATTTTVNNGVGVDAEGATMSYGNNSFTDGTSGTITPVAQN